MKKTKTHSLLSYLAVIAAVSTSIAGASTWDGGGADANFSTTLNWSDSVPGAGSALIFDGSVNTSPNNNFSNGTLGVNDSTITFNATAAAFTIGGANIETGGIVNNSAFLQTINLNLVVKGTRTINVGTAGMQFGRPVGSTGTSGRSTTKTGTGDLNIGSGTATSGGSGYSVSAGSLTFSGASATSLGSAVNNVGLASSGTTLNLKNSGSLIIGGAITTVSGSTVNLNNSGATTVTNGTSIVAGATLSGVGKLGGGAVTVNGNLTPGVIGTMAVSSLVLGSTATTTFDLDRSVGADNIAAGTGAITLGGTLDVVNLGSSLVANDTFTLFTGTLSGSFGSIILPTLDPGLGWDTSGLSPSGTGIIDVVTIVPEPTSVALLGGGMILAVWQLRRRNH